MFVHPGSKNSDKKEKGEKKMLYLFLATNITKLKIILLLNWWRKQFKRINKELPELFTQKNVIKLSKI